jgi:hypothetical protein
MLTATNALLPRIQCGACPRRNAHTWTIAGAIHPMHSRTALGEPGSHTINVPPEVPAPLRETIDIAVVSKLRTRMISPNPGNARSIIGSIASGVTSRGPIPVPPVAMTISALPSHRPTASRISSTSSGTVS